MIDEDKIFWEEVRKEAEDGNTVVVCADPNKRIPYKRMPIGERRIVAAITGILARRFGGLDWEITAREIFNEILAIEDADS